MFSSTKHHGSVRCIAVLLFACLTSSCEPVTRQPFSLSVIQSPSGAGSAEPHLARGTSGQVVLSWLQSDDAGTSLQYSAFDEGRWDSARTVARGDKWFVNWADFPSVTPIADNLWAAHWLEKSADSTYAYDVAMAISQDAGGSWSEPVTPHTDGTQTEHGFVSLFPWQAGIGALWLDGRNTIGDGHNEHGDGSGGMTLRAAVITPAQDITQPQIVDELVCDCCQTDVAISASGPIAVYRNRTTEEVRDIYVTRVIDGRWQSGKPVAQDDWVIAGCPVNGPAIAAQESDVAVAWFTAANDMPRVRFARSSNNADSFSAPIDIEVDGAIGRVDVEILDNGDAVISWLRNSKDRQAEFCVQRIAANGEPGPVRIIARTSAARLSGFPQMIRREDALLFAWTDTSGETSVVQTAIVENASQTL